MNLIHIKDITGKFYQKLTNKYYKIIYTCDVCDKIYCKKRINGGKIPNDCPIKEKEIINISDNNIKRLMYEKWWGESER